MKTLNGPAIIAALFAAAALLFALAHCEPARAADTIKAVRQTMATHDANEATLEAAQQTALAAQAATNAAQDAAIKALQDQVAKISAVQAPQPAPAPITPPTPAPGPTPQYGRLFDGMKARPPAPFAGVEIATGVLDYSKLKTPCVDPAPAGFNVDCAGKMIRPSAPNATLFGWNLTDFQVYDPDQPGLTLDSNLFRLGAGAIRQPLYLTGRLGAVTIRNNEFDGAYSFAGVNSGFDALLNLGALADYTIEGNWIHQAVGDLIQVSASGAFDGKLVIRGNVIENNGRGITSLSSSVHPDMAQVFGSSRWATDISNNLFKMDDPALHLDPGTGKMIGNATQGLFLPEGNYSSINIHNNLVINTQRTPTTDGGSVGQTSYFFIVNSTTSQTPIRITDNFIVPTGITYGVYRVQSGSGPYPAQTPIITGNKNMLTGADLNSN